MTEKLYDYNGYMTEFDAEIISCENTESGFRTVLDRTAFFPTEGGQMCDSGYLNDTAVFDVTIENGVIYHHTHAPFKEGDTVHGTIDFKERYRKMQNHSGEHIICGIAHKLYGCENVGFHLGADYVTMDLDKPLEEEEIRNLEVLADDFAPCHDQGYTMMATVYRTGAASKRDVDESSTDETVLAGGVRSYNVKKMSVLDANGGLADDSSVFDMTDGKYPYISGDERSVSCASDTKLINRYAKYEGDKGVSGRVGYVISDASMETKSTTVQVRLTHGDNKWYACIGSYAATGDAWAAATANGAAAGLWKGLIVPKGEEWNLNTYYIFDYNTANIE